MVKVGEFYGLPFMLGGSSQGLFAVATWDVVFLFC